MAIQIDGFGDGTVGSMRSGNMGTELMFNAWDITETNEVSVTMALPTTLTKVIYAGGILDTTFPDSSIGARTANFVSICTAGGGPWIEFTVGDISTDMTGSLFQAFAVGF